MYKLDINHILWKCSLPADIQTHSTMACHSASYYNPRSNTRRLVARRPKSPLIGCIHVYVPEFQDESSRCFQCCTGRESREE